MVKNLLTFLCILSSILLVSCGKAYHCLNLSNKISSTKDKYNSDRSNTENCIAYKNALNAWLTDKDCTNGDPSNFSRLQDSLNTLPCK
jgi:hypothetical protein